MHPTCGGKILGLGEDNVATLRVTSAIYGRTTTVTVREHFAGDWVSTHIELDDEGRRALILALGGES